VASRAESAVLPEAPRLGRVLRASLSDFYFNSGRLVPANLIWGASVVALWLVWLVWPLAALALSPLLALPTLGVFRVAARIVRNDGDGALRDLMGAYRQDAGPALLLGLACVAIAFVLGTNLVVGLTQSEPFGWVIGTFAGWGLVVLWCAAIVAWPLVVDPARASVPFRRRLRLAGLLLLAFPQRFVPLGAVVAVAAAVSAILLAALLTISLAFIALVACRYVYPAADRLELRLARDR
jgi:uncharacterized membrane protein YesL